MAGALESKQSSAVPVTSVGGWREGLRGEAGEKEGVGGWRRGHRPPRGVRRPAGPMFISSRILSPCSTSLLEYHVRKNLPASVSMSQIMKSVYLDGSSAVEQRPVIHADGEVLLVPRAARARVVHVGVVVADVADSTRQRDAWCRN
uniref:Uncharacterized protein n=1 Tax=Oryza rufipogon TaxID=4529 RepID=A0A0E0N2L3_ORYRU